MKQLKEIARAQKKIQYTFVFMSLLLGVTIVAQAYFIVVIVDSIFLQGAAFQEVLVPLGWLAMALIGRAYFSYVNGKAGVKLAARAKADFRKELLGKYARNPLLGSLKGQSGEKVSVLLDAVDEVDDYFSKYYPQIIQTSIVPLMIIIAIFYYNWVSGLIILVTSPFIPIFMIIIGKATQKKSEEQLEKLAQFSGKFLDILQGLTTLKLLGRAKEKREVIRTSSLDYRDSTMTVLKIAFVSSLMLEFISMLAIALVALEVGLRLVIYENLTFFTAFFVLILVPEYFNFLKELGSAFHSGRGSMGAAKNIIKELEEKEQPVKWGKLSLPEGSEPPIIELKNVHFQYGGEGEFQLKNITASIPPKSNVAVIGRSGSGKTTLLHLLSGMILPAKGDILVNGKMLYEYKEMDWYDHLSYISQNPYLFAGTIKENITVGGKGDVSTAEIRQAANKAGILEMINSLEDGFDTKVGEGGRGLSGGEKQRIALARAFLKKPSIILFDEPTVGLDLHTERILQRSMKELAESSTVITVAHRLHTIRKAEQILFLSGGELVAVGSHEELLANHLEYQNMVSIHEGGDAG